MKEGIHPAWYPNATVVCACGNTWTTGATQEEIRTDICSACHPFFTGEQRIVDTEGQVDRFMKRLQIRDNLRAERESKDVQTAPSNLSIEDLGLDKRAVNALNDSNITVVQDIIDLLGEGDEKLLNLPGVGQKILADLKKQLRNNGYEIPESQEAE